MQAEAVRNTENFKNGAREPGARGHTGSMASALPRPSRLRRAADRINVGALVRQAEEEGERVECGACAIAPACELVGVPGEALAAFMAVLDRYTLSDLVRRAAKLCDC
jgi:Rrf2 family nitric oxide-sensitive transcriptional repressor